jgi:hypothetical protein
MVEGRLAPTSEAIVQVSHRMIAFGGGDITRDELSEMRRLGKPIQFYPDDMNHDKAVAKAKAKGWPAPTPESLRGSAHAVFGT